MPEYLAPGVYMQEIPSRARPIEGVDASVTGFIGLARLGPNDQPIGPIGSLAEFTRLFGDGEDLPGARPQPNFLWYAARSFFLEGGRCLYIVRVGGASDRPGAEDYARGLEALSAIESVALLAAPGSTFRAAASSLDDALAISRSLVEHAERAPHRFTLLDLPDGLSRAEAIAWRGHFDSSRAALYHPWLEVRDADEAGRRRMPPSGAVAGVYARTDLEQGVHKAPAPALLRTAVGLEHALASADERTLGEAGVNVLSAHAGRGIRVVGARTTSNENAWKYVHVRRYCLYVEASLRKGLQWAVFEPNGEALWAAVRGAVESFLAAEWRRGALLGTRPEEAWFVRCDRSTMTQDDLDSGRLVCLVGLAMLWPAEFVILRVAHALASGGSSA